MNININLSEFFLIFVRISAFIVVAPFFSYSQVPRKVKAGFSLFLAIILFQVLPETRVEYQTVIEYGMLIIREGMTGLILGFFTNVSYYILSFAGQIIDMEIGFSMVNQFDPSVNIQTTISGNYYFYVVILMMLVTNLHYHIIIALVDTFQVIPLGQGAVSPGIYDLVLRLMRDYFIIGFRIVLPFFGALLIVNTVLGVFVKVAPQINMFVVGIQLKILVGILILFVLVGTIPVVSEFIFGEMVELMKLAIEVLS